MGTNVVFVGWDRPGLGREKASGPLFQEFLQYLGAQQKAGAIQSFESVFLNLHGGDLNGFTLIHGDSAKLDAMLSSEAWENLMIRAGLMMEGFGVLRGVSGDLLMKQMESYLRAAPG
jgi:hypothetical protein